MFPTLKNKLEYLQPVSFLRCHACISFGCAAVGWFLLWWRYQTSDTNGKVNFGDGCVLGVIWEYETHFCPHWEGEEDPMITLHSAIPTLSVWPGISLASPSEDVASPLLIPIIHDCRGDRDWVVKVNRVVYKTLIETGPCPKMLFIQIMFQSQFYPLTQDWL